MSPAGFFSQSRHRHKMFAQSCNPDGLVLETRILCTLSMLRLNFWKFIGWLQCFSCSFCSQRIERKCFHHGRSHKKQLLSKEYVKNGSFTGEKNLYRLAWLTVLCFDLTVVNWYPGFLPLELTSKLRNVRVIFPFLLAFLLKLICLYFSVLHLHSILVGMM